MAARVRGRLPWLRGSGPVFVLAWTAAVLLAGAVAGVRPVSTLAAATASVLVAGAADLHRPRLLLSVLDDLPGLVVAAVAATLVAGASPDFAVLVLAALVLAQSLVHGATLVLRRTGRLRRRALVVGTGATARRLALTLQARPELGLDPVGFVGTDDRTALEQARGLPLALHGTVASLPRAMTETHVDAAVVALAGPPGDAETAAVAGLLASSAQVYVVPVWFPPVRARVRHRRELVDGVPVVQADRRRSSLPVRAARRLARVVVAVVTLGVLLPVGAVLAVLVRIETGGVLVRRPSVDELGRSLPEPRFRTHRAHSVERRGTTFSVAVSGRIGPVGRLLRRTGLDALPAVVSATSRGMRYGGSVVSASAPRADQAEVDAGQLAR